MTGEDGGRGVVAVIGAACRFPGATDLEGFWRNLRAGVSSVVAIPAERWDRGRLRGCKAEQVTAAYGVLEDMDAFDHAFFGISAQEAAAMDPQQRLLLQEVWHCIEDAGIAPSALRGTRTAVFAGMMGNDYLQASAESVAEPGRHAAAGLSSCMLANRISYFFGLRGMSVTVDAACASSLVALHQARKCLLAKEADFAIVAAASVSTHRFRHAAFSEAGMISRTGACKTFDARADGYVPGEGVGVVLLQRVAEAVAEGSRVRVLVAGTAVNHVGRSRGLSAPSRDAQTDVILAAYEDAGFGADTVSYVEAHGTGTSLGDPIEVAALTAAFRTFTKEAQYCLIGSVKTNLGHLEPVAGLAGLIKVILMMEAGEVPPSLNLRLPNPLIDFGRTPFKVAERLERWNARAPGLPLRAGVSSFGFGGVNSHVLLQSPPRSEDVVQGGQCGEGQPFLLSAASQSSLVQLVASWREHAASEKVRASNLRDVCGTLATGRAALPFRLGGWVDDWNVLRRFIETACVSPQRVCEEPWCLVIGDIGTVVSGAGDREPSAHSRSDGRLDPTALEAACRYLSDLRAYGFSPAEIVSRETGIWVALAASEIISLQDAVSLLRGARRFEEISLRRPSTLLMDPVSGKKLSRFRLDETYVERLLCAARGEEAAAAQSVAVAIRLVESRQQTYLRLLREWRPLLGECGDALAWLEAGAPAHPHRLLLVTVSMIALRSLHQRWELTDLNEHLTPALRELVGLVADDVVPKQSLVGVMTGTVGLERVAAVARDNQRQIGFCPLLEGQSVGLPEIEPFGAWLREALNAKMQRRNGGSGPSLIFGGTEGTRAGDVLAASMEQFGEEAASRTALELWRAGADICWDHRFARGTFRRASAPGYPFGRERHWFSAGKSPAAPVAVARTEQGAERPDEGSSVHTFVPTWQRVHMLSGDDGVERSARSEPVLVFAPEQRWAEALSRDAGDQPVLVVPGKQFERAAERAWYIDPRRREDYVRLAQSLMTERLWPQLVVHGWNAQAGVRSEDDSQPWPPEALERGVVSVLSSIDALRRVAPTRAPRYVFLHRRTGSTGDPMSWAVAGIAHSLGQLWPRARMQCVEFDDDVPVDWQLLSHLASEAGRSCELRIERGQWFERAAQPCRLTRRRESFRKGGVYLVTGGLGRLGRLVCRHLIEEYAARLVIVGRSALGDESRRVLRELAGDGERIRYVCGAIESPAVAQRAVKEALVQFGALHGILHLAGHMAGSGGAGKARDQWISELAGKIGGAIALERAIDGLPVELFVVFSSLASVLGDFGQATYAAANCYLDALVARRNSEGRPGRSVAVNWPLWRHGGIHLAPDAEAAYLRSAGLSYLETTDGVGLLDEIVASGNERTIVIVGDGQRVRQMIELEPTSSSASSLSPKGSVCAEQRDWTPAAFESAITEVVAARLGRDRTLVGPHESFADLGFDSLGMKELSVALSDALALELSPATFFAYSTIRKLSHHLSREKTDTSTPSRSSDASDGGSVTVTMPSPSPSPSASPSRPAPVTVSGARAAETLGDSAAEEVDDERDIAIVGMSATVGRARNPNELWEALRQGRELVEPTPAERWSEAMLGRFDPEERRFLRRGCFIPEVERFDHEFFAISPKEAARMDPQQRWLLQTAWEALEDAGYRPSQLAGRLVGVFVGAQFRDYSRLIDRHRGNRVRQTETGNALAMLSNRLSYQFDLRGPSEVVDTACSSSLVALHRAVQALRDGDCEAALVGGVSLMLAPETTAEIAQLGILSPEGRCRTFDRDARGYVRGEGVVVLVIKPLARARESRDHIYGVIKAIRRNHGGRANSLTAPNPRAQAELIVSAVEEAGIEVDSIGYIEVHGTGTELGDPVETEGLRAAFDELGRRQGRAPRGQPYCGLGSIKTNIGHLEPASGLAGVVKVLLGLQHNVLPAHLHVETLNPMLRLEGSPFFVVTEARPWHRLPDGRGGWFARRAGVSSFGFGGANAHAIIEEPPRQPAAHGGDGPCIVPLSACTIESLREVVERLRRFLSGRVATRDPSSGDHDGKRSERLPMRAFDRVLEWSAVEMAVPVEELRKEPELIARSLGVAGLTALIQRVNTTFGVSLNPALPYATDPVGAMVEELEAIDGEKRAGGMGGVAADGPQVSLCDLAFTLQVGREAFNERLAVVASDMQDLMDALDDFLAGRARVGRLFVGRAKPEVLTPSILCSDEDGRHLVERWSRLGRLAKLAGLWVNGVELDWSLLPQHERCCRVSLPTYPFAGVRHGLEEKPGATPEGSSPRQQNVTEPQRQDGVSVFSQRISAQSALACDHKVRQQKILAGVVAIELACTAAASAAGAPADARFCLSDVVWRTPVRLEGEQELRVVIRRRGHPDRFAFSVRSGRAPDEACHVEGEIVAGRAAEVAAGEPLVLSELEARCQVRLEARELYDRLSARGVVYGPLFRTVQALTLSADRQFALARLKEWIEPAAAAGARNVPGLLDGALQTTSVLWSEEERRTLLPFSVDRVVLGPGLRGAVHAWVVRRGPLRFDISLLDSSGQSVASLQGACFRPAPPEEERPDSAGEAASVILEAVSETIGIAAAKLERRKAFSELGVDSIAGVELIRTVNRELGLALRTSVIFDYPTIDQLIEHVVTKHKVALVKPRLTRAVATDSALVSDDVGGSGAASSTVPAAEAPAGHHGTALVLAGPCQLEELRLVQCEVPEPGPCEVLIEVRAFSLNFGDLLCVKGLYPTMPDYPFTPGFEVSGVVVAAGSAVKRVRVGDEVLALMGARLGGHASFATTEERLTVRKPTRLSFQDACALPVAFVTAYHVFERAALERGETVLIHNAAGGVGQMALQIAKSRGARIVATVGSESKLRSLHEQGVELVINYREGGFVRRVHELTAGRGVDVVINTLPGDAIQEGLDVLAPGGRYVEIAMTALRAARALDLSRLVDNQSFISVDMRRLLAGRPELAGSYLERMTTLIEDGELFSLPTTTFDFEHVRDAYRYMEERRNIGKIVVSIPRQGDSTSADAPSLARDASPTGAFEPVAIIGMSGRFPRANNVRQLWRLLAAGESAIERLPGERRDAGGAPECGERWGGFLSDIDKFDALFFGISGREAELMDPQQRLFLEESWRALEDAGYADERVAGRRVGVFCGVAAGDYVVRLRQAGQAAEPQAFWGNEGSVAPARLSYFLDLKGPCLSIDTACSSSLVAIHTACRSIASGESEMAVAGGVFVRVTSEFHAKASRAGMLSPSGQCRAFDDGANGFVCGEAVAAVVLKPLSAALRDGDLVYGVIRGSGVNQDGKTNGLTSPSSRSQEELERAVYRESRTDPSTITLVEAHGTGTRLGDPIELEALTRAFRTSTSKEGYCAIGSVKTNIGHAATAAGVASVVKVLLALSHEAIPGTLNFERENREISFQGSPFFANRSLLPWPGQGRAPRRAAISSFGFSGTNAHLVIEEPPARRRESPCDEAASHLLVVSARTPTALRQSLLDLAAWFEGDGRGVPVRDVAFTLALYRKHFPVRAALVVDRTADISASLRAVSEQPIATSSVVSDLRDGTETSSRRDCASERGPHGNGSPGRSQPEQAAEAFLRGDVVDFGALFAHSAAQRVSLPTYPFARERHWVQIAEEFERREGKEIEAGWWVVGEHVVGNVAMMPGVGYLRLANGWDAEWGEEVELRDVAWARPLEVRDRRSVVVKRYDGDKRSVWEVRSVGKEGDEEVLHARGEVGRSGDSRGQEERVDVQKLRERMSREEGGEEMYARYGRVGIEYGPRYRVVKRMWIGSGEALAWLESGGEEKGLAVLDGALQSISGVWQREGEERALPYGVKRVLIRGGVPPRGYAHVKRLDGGGLYEVRVVDEQGRVRVSFEEVQVRRWKEKREGDSSASDARTELYVPQWSEQAPEEAEESEAGHGAVLAVHGPGNVQVAEELARQERARGERVVLIELGERTESRSAGRWTWASGDRGGLGECLREAGEVKRLYYLGGLELQRPEMEGVEAVRRAQGYGVVALYRLIRGLSAEGKLREGLELKVVTANAQVVRGHDEVQPNGAALIGWCKALSKEMPQVKVCCVDVERAALLGDQHDREVTSIVAERVGKQGTEVAVRDGARHVRRLVKVSRMREGKDPLKRGGVYLVVGGGGGIGLEVSGWLCARYAARLVLMGRRELQEGQAEKIRGMQAAGGAVRYVRGDATKEADVARAVQEAQEAYGGLDGVFHLALVLEDRSIERMDEGTLLRALEAKVLTSVAVEKAMAGQGGLVVFFSSAQSLWANAGQSNYAAGCAFQDAYGHFLQRAKGRRVKVINWGYWRNVGVVATEAYRERLGRQGIYGIEVNEGLEALEATLKGGAMQVLAFKGSEAMLRRMGVEPDRHVEVYAEEMPAVGAEVSARVQQLMARAGESAELIARGYQQIERWGRGRLVRALAEMGAWREEHCRVDDRLLARRLGVVPEYQPLFGGLMRALRQSGDIDDKDGYRRLATGHPSAALELRARRARLAADFPDVKGHLELMEAVLDAAPQIMRGSVPATDVIFPDSSSALVEALYRGHRLADYFNELIAEACLGVVEQHAAARGEETIRILEVGGGTGGTTLQVLPLLENRKVEYLFTDVSPSFVRNAQRTLEGRFPLARFATFDLERHPSEQGLEGGRFDVVLGSNVLHATKRIRTTLRHIKHLLKQNGVLLINELTGASDYALLTFGFLKGWWLFADDEERIPCSPLLDLAHWQRALRREGLFATASLSYPGKLPSSLSQHVIGAVSDGIIAMESAPRGAPAAPVRVVVAPSRPVKAPTSVRPSKSSLGSNGQVERRIVALLSEVLCVDADELRPQLPFTDFGVDSVLAVDLAARIARELSVELRSTDLFNYGTIRKLAAHIETQLGAATVAQTALPEAGGRSSDEQCTEGPIGESLTAGEQELWSALNAIEQGALQVADVAPEVERWLEERNGS